MSLSPQTLANRDRFVNYKPAIDAVAETVIDLVLKKASIFANESQTSTGNASGTSLRDIYTLTNAAAEIREQAKSLVGQMFDPETNQAIDPDHYGHSLVPSNVSCYRTDAGPQLSYDLRGEAWRHGQLYEGLQLPNPTAEDQYSLTLIGGTWKQEMPRTQIDDPKTYSSPSLVRSIQARNRTRPPSKCSLLGPKPLMRLT
jgi:hypothetical protein